LPKLPRDAGDKDYSAETAGRRRKVVEEATGGD